MSYVVDKKIGKTIKKLIGFGQINFIKSKQM